MPLQITHHLICRRSLPWRVLDTSDILVVGRCVKYADFLVEEEQSFSKSVVTSNLHETTLCYFEKNCSNIYYRKQKGNLNILLFPVVRVPLKLDI